MTNFHDFSRPWRRIANLALAGICFVFLLLANGNVFAAESDAAVSVEDLESSIDKAAIYLVRVTKKDGLFQYRVNTNPAVSVKPAYNILRHAGTIYAMTMYLAEHPNEAMYEAVLRAGEYLRDEAVAPLPIPGELLAVWSKPEVNMQDNPLLAKLGGAGLGLVALTSVEKEVRAGLSTLADLQALGRFIIFLQKEDGSFYSRYIPSKGGRDDSWTSLYYPGEAALGLLMLYEMDQENLWLAAARKALIYLARLRKDKKEVPVDHWVLLATAKLLSMDSIGIGPEERSLLIGHAVQICETILEQQLTDLGVDARNGGFKANGRVTPSATRLEGLLAARTFLPSETELSRRIDDAIHLGIAFLLRAQISDGLFDGGFPRAIGMLDEGKPESRSTEIRIDYVQHALSALIQYREIREAADLFEGAVSTPE